MAIHLLLLIGELIQKRSCRLRTTHRTSTNTDIDPGADGIYIYFDIGIGTDIDIAGAYG